MQIIGQKKVIKQLTENTLPTFSLLVGKAGSGKRTLVKYIGEQLKINVALVDNKIDSIRFMIEDSIALSSDRIYYIGDGDNMGLPAMNALLKLAEEPPKHAHIIVGVSDPTNVLPTLISRAKLIYLDNFTKDEILQYINYKGYTNISQQMVEIVTTPGEVDKYMEAGFETVYSYAEKVYNNILKVSTPNSFKIDSKLSYKNEDGIPIELFMSCFYHIVASALFKTDSNSLDVKRRMLDITSQCINKLSNKSFNKQLAFSIWLLDIRSLR